MIALNRVLLLILLSNISINGFHLKNGVKEDFQCEKLYGTFFIDKSIPGNSVMEKQTEIIKSFFNVNYRPTLTSFVSSSSQIETAITNKFDTVEPFNYKFLNEQFGSILEKTSVDENVSFYKLAAEVLVNVDYTDIEKYTQRPLITLMINSFVEDKETTENLLNNIKKFNPTVKIVAIIFDEMFAEDAIFLTGDSSLVFTFDKTLENDVNNAGAWLVNQICGDLTPAETVPVPSTINDACPSSFCNFAFAIDSSSDILTQDLFSTEISITTNSIGPLIPDFTKVAVVSYNQGVSGFSDFNSIPDENTFNQTLASYTLSTGYSLTNALAKIDSLTPPLNGKLTTYVFISKYDPADYASAIPYSISLTNKGSLNFIILGTATNKNDLSQLTYSQYFALTFANSCDQAAIKNFIYGSMTCNNPICTTTVSQVSTTTTSPVSTTTTSPVSTTTASQCVPQNTQCNVAIAVDASNDILIDQYFNSEKNVITNNISGVFTDFTKIELQAYNGQVTPIFGFNGISTKDQFINSVNGITNGPGFDFSDSLARIDQTSPSNGVGLSTYIFVSKNDQAQFMQAMPSAASLKSKGSLNFIILGTDVKPSDLQMFNPSSIVTYNLGDCDDGTLVNFFTLSLTCTVVCPSTTTQVPSTTTTQVSTTTTQVSTTTQVPSTTTTPVSTTTTSPVSTTTVSQCVPQNTQCNVAIAVDASNDILIDQYFNSEKNVITNNISGVFSDFTKIELQAYNGQVTPIFGFNGISTKDQFVNSVNGITNGPGFDFSDSLARIDQTSPSNGVGLSTYIFVSKNDQAQFMQAMSSAASLKSKGSLNFIILGTDVKPSDLQMLNPSSIVTYNLGDCDDGTLLNFFTHSLTCTVVCSSTTTQTPSTTTTQVPSTTTSQVTSTTTSQVSTTTTQQCVSQNIQCNIAIAVDASTDILINQYFNAEKVAIASNISGIFTDYTRIELQSYNGQITPIFGFNGISSQPEFINYVNGITNGPGFDFKDSLARIDQTSPSNGIGLSTYIFVSKNDQDQFSQSLIYANSLINLKPSDLQMFNTPNIFTYDLGDCDDAMLMNFFNHQLMCNAPCLTTTTQTPSTTTSQPSTTTQLSTTTSQASSTTTPCPCPTQICDMAIVIDSSNDFLTLEYFNNEKQSLQYNISDQFTDFSRIALLNYDSSTTVVGNFGQMSNQSDFNTKINYMNQNQGSSLSTALNTLLSLTPPNNGILNSFIYISQITPQELTASIPLVAQLTSYGTVNFIILGTALKPSDIAPLNPTNVIEFDLALCDSGPVSQFFNTSLQCTQICGTLTQSNNLIFAVDASSDVLDATEFQYQKDTLVNNISSIINNYRSTALTWYNSVPNTVYGFGQISNVFEFQQDSLLIQQNSGSKLSLLLSALDSMTLTANIADTFVFISKNDPTEINNSINSALSLTKKGTLSFILVGTDIHPGDLSQLPLDSNAIFVWDFTNCPIANLVNFFSSRIKTSAQCISPKYVPY
uniref:VWFA domain-containing protein n=1 Tax=Parastrongyloides trichosuri TaxID=131310 RepID=A0A0N4Z0R8_PARTI